MSGDRGWRDWSDFSQRRVDDLLSDAPNMRAAIKALNLEGFSAEGMVPKTGVSGKGGSMAVVDSKFPGEFDLPSSDGSVPLSSIPEPTIPFFNTYTTDYPSISISFNSTELGSYVSALPNTYRPDYERIGELERVVRLLYATLNKVEFQVLGALQHPAFVDHLKVIFAQLQASEKRVAELEIRLAEIAELQDTNSVVR